MSLKKPHQVFVHVRYVPVADHAEVLRMCGEALKTSSQFSVSPYPNDLKSTVQTYWMVSWPMARAPERSAA